MTNKEQMQSEGEVVTNLDMSCTEEVISECIDRGGYSRLIDHARELRTSWDRLNAENQRLWTELERIQKVEFVEVCDEKAVMRLGHKSIGLLPGDSVGDFFYPLAPEVKGE